MDEHFRGEKIRKLSILFLSWNKKKLVCAHAEQRLKIIIDFLNKGLILALFYHGMKNEFALGFWYNVALKSILKFKICHFSQLMVHIVLPMYKIHPLKAFHFKKKKKQTNFIHP